MARKNRRDCRVGERKKAGGHNRRDEQIRAIRKQKKTQGSAPAEQAPAAAAAAEGSTTASFLERMRAEVASDVRKLRSVEGADASTAAAGSPAAADAS